MLEKNYKTVQALKQSGHGSIEGKDTNTNNNTNMDFSRLGDAHEDLSMDVNDDEMEVEDGEEEGEPSKFKDKVLKVLKEGGFEEKRASKLTLQEFLYLLSLFNKAAIHFS